MRKPPRHIIFPFLAFSFLLLTISAEAQQLKLGNNPTVIDPSAVLQLESPNQGLLLTRVPDTSAINAFSPPDGMIIYFTDGATSEPYGSNAGVYERKNGKWQRVLFAGDGSIGIVSLNGSIIPAQTFATGTSGTGFNISTNVATGIHTFNIPMASVIDTGLVNIGAQTFAGAKTFANTLTLGQDLVASGSSGTNGNILRSRGAGFSPIWESLALDSLANVQITSPVSSGQILQYNGSNWINAAGGSGLYWSLKGNNIPDTTSFLGTTDYQPLIFKAGGKQVGYLGPSGSNSNIIFGIGSSANFQSIAIGDNAAATQNNSLALGFNVTANAFQSIAVGVNAQTSNNNSIAIGYGATAGGQRGIAIGNTASAFGQNAVAIGYNASAPNPNTIILGNGANVGIGIPNPAYPLQVAGTIGATTFFNTSDIRYKKNLQELHHVLSAIDSLHGYTYFFRTKKFRDKDFPATEQIGMIAQEVEKYFPELVSTDKEGYKSLNYAQFTAVLLEAIKEQQAEINVLKKENKQNKKIITDQLNALQQKVDALEKMVEKK